jgi:hypothetical protein
MIKSKKKLSDLQQVALTLPPSGLKSLVLANGENINLPDPETFKIKIDPEVMRQIAEIQRQWKELKTLAPPWLAELSEAARRASENWAQISSQIKAAMEPYKPILAEIARTAAECKRIEAAGWLPHYTTPFAVLAECDGDADELSAAIEERYRERWPEVRASFLEHVETYEIDEEAKATFREVLDAHGHGLYRLSARSLFPEIEAVTRKEIHNGSLRPITSQKALKELAGHLGLRDTQPGGLYAMALFNKLFDHLYAHLQTEEELVAASSDTVPNRHASLHGLLSYGTARSSMNALIMTDFIFQIVCALKRDAAEQAQLEANQIDC